MQEIASAATDTFISNFPVTGYENYNLSLFRERGTSLNFFKAIKNYFILLKVFFDILKGNHMKHLHFLTYQVKNVFFYL